MKLRFTLFMLAALLLVCACAPSCPGDATEPPQTELPATEAPATEAPVSEMHNDHSLTKLRMIGKGNESSGYKLSFREPKTLEGAKGFIVCYSVLGEDTVWDYLKSLDYAGILALDKPVNRAYVITDLSYCDGVGNTLNTAQKDIVTGEPFSEPGTHYFYAAVFGENGVLSLECAEQTAEIAASVGAPSFTSDSGTVSGRFSCPQGIERAYLFLSHDGYVGIGDRIAKLDPAALDRLVESGCVQTFAPSENVDFSFDIANAKDIDGNGISDESWYYVYTVGAAAGKLTVLAYCADNFVTPDTLPASSGIIGAGNGMLFPNGGAATIGKGRASIISASQAYFADYPDDPRIAVIGASSGSESEIWSYFYRDDPSVRSFEHRFADAGFEAVYIPLTTENRDGVGNDPYFAALVASCHGVYFTGGDQSLAMYALRDDSGGFNAVGRAVIDVFERGGFLSGTSAGAHVLGSVCYQDADPHYVLTHPQPASAELTVSGVSCGKEGAIYRGIPCDTAASGHTLVFDSHFGARGRLARLIVMQKAGGADYAIGLDEATGIQISAGIGTVFGAGTVTIVDARGAVYGEDPDRFTVTGLRLTVLSQGDRFDFSSGTLIPAASRINVEESLAFEPPNDILDGGSVQTRALLGFAAGDAARAEYAAEAENEAFTFIFTRAEDFSVFTDSRQYSSAALSGLSLICSAGIVLDIV